MKKNYVSTILFLAISGWIVVPDFALAQKAKLSDQTSKNLTDVLRAEIIKGGCSGCKEFQLVCTRDEQVSRADQLNGVTERKVAGMTYVILFQEKYQDSSRMASFVKQKGVWTIDRLLCPGIGGADLKGCRPAC